MFLEDRKKGLPPAQLFISPRRLTMESHGLLFASQLDGPHALTDQYPKHSGITLFYASQQWPTASGTH